MKNPEATIRTVKPQGILDMLDTSPRYESVSDVPDIPDKKILDFASCAHCAYSFPTGSPVLFYNNTRIPYNMAIVAAYIA